MTNSMSSMGTVQNFDEGKYTVLHLIVFTGLQFSQVNSHTVQLPQVVGVAMDTVASYPLSFNHSVRYVQDHLVLIG